MSCLALSELPVLDQVHIYRTSIETTMRWVDSVLPATAADLPRPGVTPGVAVAGNFSMEPNA